MNTNSNNFNQLLSEYVALGVAHGSVQRRCTELISQLDTKIAAQQGEIMQLRAAVIVRDSALAFASTRSTSVTMQSVGPHEQALEASLNAADLVICQTGCLSHGDYWRVQDHCKRLGKTCVLVEQPDALRIVRIHKTAPTGS